MNEPLLPTREYNSDIRLKKSNLKKKLCESEFMSETSDLPHSPNSEINQFFSDRNKIIQKRVLSNDTLSERRPRRNLHFSKTEVHLVENWKNYNKPPKRCCFCF